MDLGIRDRTALVFGGSKGLGRGVAEALAGEGVAVALVARGGEALERATSEITARHGVAAHGFSADLSDHTAVAQAIDRAEAALGGRIDILVNNTGGPPPSGVAGIPADIWSAQFQSMLLSIFRITDRVLPSMRAAGWGRVLTVASSVVVEPVLTLGVSATLRSALVGWSKTLSSEVAADGVTVNLLLPGLIATDRTAFLDKTIAEREGVSVEAAREGRTRTIPVGRYGTPEEFGAVAAFLASRQAAYITGSMIRLDGGALRSV